MTEHVPNTGRPVAEAQRGTVVLAKRWYTWLAATPSLWFIGLEVQGIYGLDPPYVVYFSGLGLQLLSLAAGAVCIVKFVRQLPPR